MNHTHQDPRSLPERRGGHQAALAGATQRTGQDRADCVRLEIGNEPVCYPVRRAIYAGTWITRCSTASPTKMRTGSRSFSVVVPLDFVRLSPTILNDVVTLIARRPGARLITVGLNATWAPASLRETKWINPARRVISVLIDVDAAIEADRVFRHEPSATRIIVPVPVVMQPRLLILLLPLKPQRIPRHDPRRLRRPRDHLPRFAPRLVRRLIELVPLLEVHHCICLQVTLRLQHLCGQHTLPSCSRVTKAEPESANLAISLP